MIKTDIKIPVDAELRKCCPCDGEDIYKMLLTIPADENGFINDVFGKTFDEYKLFLQKQYESSMQVGLSDGWKVPQTTYWLYVDGVPVGISKVRHFLTDALLKSGGNIGYAVAPEFRGRGYGKLLLKLTLAECPAKGLKKVLITADADNIPSIKTAVANGGIIEKEENGEKYIWIDVPQDEQD